MGGMEVFIPPHSGDVWGGSIPPILETSGGEVGSTSPPRWGDIFQNFPPIKMGGKQYSAAGENFGVLMPEIQILLRKFAFLMSKS